MWSGERANTRNCIDKSLWPTLLQDRERVERYFSVEGMVQETEALYEELIGEKMVLEWAEGEGWQPI